MMERKWFSMCVEIDDTKMPTPEQLSDIVADALRFKHYGSAFEVDVIEKVQNE